jgi:probable phosphoglycerate mutase
LGRALQTATIIAKQIKLEIQIDSRLRERNLGLFQGLNNEELKAGFPLEYANFQTGNPDYMIPEGESYRQMTDRISRCFAEIALRHTGQNIIVITHGGVLGCLFRWVLEIPLGSKRHFSLPNAALNLFTVTDHHWRLESWADIHHLPDSIAADYL